MNSGARLEQRSVETTQLSKERPDAARAGVRRRELSRFKQVEREDCAHHGGRFGDRWRRSASLRVGCNLRLRRFGWTVHARMIAAFSSPPLPSVRFAQPRLEGQPYRVARQNEHQRQTGNAPRFACRDARPIQLGLLRTFSIRAWTIATRSARGNPSGTMALGLLRLGNPNLTVRFANRNLEPTKRALSRSFFLARDRRARNYFRTHDLFYLAFPMKGCEQGDYNEAK